MDRINIKGQKFGRLTVLEDLPSVDYKTFCRCRCDCGNEMVTRAILLRRNHTRSCGCIAIEILKKRNKTHGMTYTPIYEIWYGMIKRCESKNSSVYRFYGGRGITVCRRWYKFENFFKDMGHRPEGKSIDRINTYKGYSPTNCRWATDLEQANNSRRNVKITYMGKTQNASQWARELKINYNNLRWRFKDAKWPIEKCFNPQKHIRQSIPKPNYFR